MYRVYGLRYKTYISKVGPRRSKNERKGSTSNHPPQPPTRNGFRRFWWLFDYLYITRWMCYYYSNNRKPTSNLCKSHNLCSIVIVPKPHQCIESTKPSSPGVIVPFREIKGKIETYKLIKCHPG